MKDPTAETDGAPEAQIPNGAAAAAILAAGAGCFAVGVCAWLGDAFPAAGRFFSFYNPTGPLSGVTTTAILIWLVLWVVLSKAWNRKSLPMGMVNLTAFLLLGLGMLLVFPPFGDFLQGK
jgi:hypothetical protein